MKAIANPEKTTEHISPANGWVLYDADCGMCTQLVRFLQPVLQRYAFQVAPLQSTWAKDSLGLADASGQQELLKEMRLLTLHGQVYGGADAILAIARRIWWAYPFYAAGYLPGIKPVLRRLYRWIAERRRCTAQGCTIPKPSAPE